jgi:hypothetical protein
MKGTLVAAMLVAAALGGVTQSARAGAIGDAVVAVGGWVSATEAAVAQWIDRVWSRAVASGSDERAAGAFRQLLVEAPGRIDELAGRAGYTLSAYSVARGDRQDMVLQFRYARELDPTERQSLARELQDPVSLDVRPELSLLRILLDASDWRDAGSGGRFMLTGVEVRVDDDVSSRLIFSKAMVTQ